MITKTEKALADRLRSVRCKLNNQSSKITVPFYAASGVLVQDRDPHVDAVSLAHLRDAVEKIHEADIHLKAVYDDLQSRRYD